MTYLSQNRDMSQKRTNIMLHFRYNDQKAPRGCKDSPFGMKVANILY